MGRQLGHSTSAQLRQILQSTALIIFDENSCHSSDISDQNIVLSYMSYAQSPKPLRCCRQISEAQRLKPLRHDELSDKPRDLAFGFPVADFFTAHYFCLLWLTQSTGYCFSILTPMQLQSKERGEGEENTSKGWRRQVMGDYM